MFQGSNTNFTTQVNMTAYSAHTHLYCQENMYYSYNRINVDRSE